jgi:hypothetical protein
MAVANATMRGETALDRNMTQAFALRRMWEMFGTMEEMAIRTQENARIMVMEFGVMKDGCDGMRMQMEDGVALVCSDVGCACS